jgi:hypothetical protein
VLPAVVASAYWFLLSPHLSARLPREFVVVRHLPRRRLARAPLGEGCSLPTVVVVVVVASIVVAVAFVVAVLVYTGEVLSAPKYLVHQRRLVARV